MPDRLRRPAGPFPGRMDPQVRKQRRDKSAAETPGGRLIRRLAAFRTDRRPPGRRRQGIGRSGFLGPRRDRQQRLLAAGDCRQPQRDRQREPCHDETIARGHGRGKCPARRLRGDEEGRIMSPQPPAVKAEVGNTTDGGGQRPGARDQGGAKGAASLLAIWVSLGTQGGDQPGKWGNTECRLINALMRWVFGIWFIITGTHGPSPRTRKRKAQAGKEPSRD